MFWGMVEVGVAMVTVNLPTFRPLVQALLPENILQSLRSALTLRLMGSGKRSSPNSTKRAGRSESETAITGVLQGGKYGFHGLDSGEADAYAMTKVSREKYQVGKTFSNGIWRETEVKQTSQVV